METINILLTALRLLYYEKSIFEINGSDSRILIKDLITRLDRLSKPINSEKSTMIDNLKRYLFESMENFEQHSFDLGIMKQELKLLTNNKELVELLSKDLEVKKEKEEIQQIILRYRDIIKRFINTLKLKEVSIKLAKDIRSKKITNLDSYLDNLNEEISELRSGFSEDDPAIKNRFSLTHDNIKQKIETMQDEVNNGLLLKTEFVRLNKILDGGFRRGELVTVTARDHGYKSGFSRSIFLQLLKNKPVVMDKNKKPLLILLSLEDTDKQILKFIFEYFKSCDGETTKIYDVSLEEAVNYIIGKLYEEDGWNIEILNVDPSNWGFKDVFNMIEDYESKGFEVIGLLVDYLSLLNKIGCKGTGVTGSETRELFRRIGNYCRAKDILFITPHQASSALKTLLDNGVKDQDILREVYGRGYFADTRQIGQEHDIGILIHPCIVGDDKYLNVAVDKHRGFVIDYSKAFWYYKFPKYNMPIPGDNGKDKAITSLDDAEDDIF